ncbi:sugar ABC transporter permease [Paenibacillus dendritiformis]|uniref:Binding-protein-dependent transport systems inner membrane component n=1 Tax=Paenibacillus dendritiformis C454 TaxID=1131935 RepID=H3SAW3_9BACL|nr:sugar ABC transporter permease [Paenibacillus dendritiformis]EHQ63696.1 binding-protein-dependent transport systems inner membrane component [Paenibacillus dendritiformis C454]TDL57610.1 sugar ABC transporter permease [Paenibacillus dendritiformis]WGU94525.1 sugar ABC transporter permease [Paenibacillus dendritiformis]CAH8772540.1 sugar ABC transporter permease [Paenibacillus dendritiformis]
MGKKMLKAKTSRNLEALLFVGPWIIGFLLFMAFPLGFSLYMSFHKVTVLPTGLKYDFQSFKYYSEILFGSSALYDNLIPFFQEIVIMVPIILVFSLFIAIMLNQDFPGRMLFRVVFFLPIIFTSGYILTEFVNQGEGTLGFLDRFSIGEYLDEILSGSSWAKPVKDVLNRFVLVLWYSGVQILIFLAGRQTISKSSYESARIDGATPWEVFWKITLPAMSPFILLNLIYTVVDMFTFPYNPVIELINTGNYGYNSALAWIYFVIIVVFLSLVLLLFLRINRSGRRRG